MKILLADDCLLKSGKVRNELLPGPVSALIGAFLIGTPHG